MLRKELDDRHHYHSSRQLSSIGPGQYLDGRLLGNFWYLGLGLAHGQCLSGPPQGADIVPVSTSGRVSPSGKANASGDNNAQSIAFGCFSLRGHSSNCYAGGRELGYKQSLAATFGGIQTQLLNHAASEDANRSRKPEKANSCVSLLSVEPFVELGSLNVFEKGFLIFYLSRWMYF